MIPNIDNSLLNELHKGLKGVKLDLSDNDLLDIGLEKLNHALMFIIEIKSDKSLVLIQKLQETIAIGKELFNFKHHKGDMEMKGRTAAANKLEKVKSMEGSYKKVKKDENRAKSMDKREKVVKGEKACGKMKMKK